MDWTRFPPSILALGKGVGILLSVAFGSINSVKYGVHKYNDLTGTPNMALALPQESVVVQFGHEPKPCPTCLFVDMDDRLLDYYGRPLSLEAHIFAHDSNLPQAMGSTTPLTVNFAAPSTPNSTGTYTTPSTPYAIPVSTPTSETSFSPAPDTSYFEVGLSWFEVILLWWAFPLESIAFYGTNTRTSSGILARSKRLAWLILWRLASAIFPRAAVAWFYRMQKMRKIQFAKNASSKANAQFATETNATQNAILETFADIIHEYNHDPATMTSAINGLLVAQYGDACTLKTASEEGKDDGEIQHSKVADQGPEKLADLDEEGEETIDDVLKDTFRLEGDSEEALHDSPSRDAKDLLDLEKSKWSEEKHAYVAIIQERDGVIADLRIQLHYEEQEVAANRDYIGTVASTMREKDQRIEQLEDFAAQCMALHQQGKGRNVAVSSHTTCSVSNKKAPLSAELFHGRSDAELENDPEWHAYLAMTAEETATDADGVPPTEDVENLSESKVEVKTAITDISERNDRGRIDHQASPPEECDAQKGKSFVHQDHRSELILSPARFDLEKQLLTAKSTLSFVEQQIQYLSDGHGTPKDPHAKPSSDIPRASTTGQTGEAAQLKEKWLAIWRKDSILAHEKQVEKLRTRIATLESAHGAVTGNAFLSPARAEPHLEEVSATSTRALQRKRAKAKAKAKAKPAEEAAETSSLGF